MSQRKIIIYGDSILRKKALPVSEINDEIIKLTEDMIETMYKAPGIGLAANQLGIDKQIIAVDLKVIDPQAKAFIIINPKIIASDGIDTNEEGCLSFPGINIEIKRSTYVKVEGINIKGEKIKLESENLLARILQHEIDHINGVLFIDHLNFVRKQLLRKELKELEFQFHQGT